MRRLPFVHVDVFTRVPLAGNGLTVFTDARGLSDADCAALARETRQAETTFVFPDPARDAASGVRVRIFAMQGELPFAGHPTLGTAAVLRATSSRPEIVLALEVGPIPVRFEPTGFGEMRQNPVQLGPVVARDRVAQALGVEPLDGVPCQRASTGLPFLIVPVPDVATLRSLAPLHAQLQPLLEAVGAQGVYVVARDGQQLEARMFDRDGEDPATGSAAGACTGWMLAHRWLQPDERKVVRQGASVRRPSELHVRAADGAIFVGGFVVEVARGVVELPG